MASKLLQVIRGPGRSSVLSSCVRCFSSNPLDNNLFTVPGVEISGEGTFRYLLLLAYNHGETGKGKHIVRGYLSAKKHRHVLDRAKPEIEAKGVCTKVKGGGKIRHNPEKKRITLYGKSDEFGEADHEEAKDILLKKFPNYYIDIICSHRD